MQLIATLSKNSVLKSVKESVGQRAGANLRAAASQAGFPKVLAVVLCWCWCSERARVYIVGIAGL